MPAAKLTRAQRKRLGAWYTPPQLVEAVCREAMFEGARSALDPACGDGRFLAATGLADLTGVDIDPATTFIHDDALSRDWDGRQWDVVVGNRHHADTTTVVAPTPLRAAGHRVINAATRAVLAGGYGDTQCGLKAFRSDVAGVLFGHASVDGFAFDIELLVMVERYGFSLTEVPVEVENSELSTVKVARDSARLLVDLARLRLRVRRGAYDLAPGELDALAPPAR